MMKIVISLYGAFIPSIEQQQALARIGTNTPVYYSENLFGELSEGEEASLDLFKLETESENDDLENFSSDLFEP